MSFTHWKQGTAVFWALTFLLAVTCTVHAQIVTITDPDTDLILSETRSSGADYYEWTLNDGTTTTNAWLVLGDAGASYNRLTIDSGQTLGVGARFKVGTGSISHFSHFNRVDVSGRLNVDRLDISNGYNSLNNTLSIQSGGIVTANTFELYAHWSYGHNWLELNGGMLFLTGNQASGFDTDQGILSSIKVWDDATGAYQLVAEYDSAQLVVDDAYYNQLLVEYIGDIEEAEALGISSEFVGTTLITNVSAVPVPSSLYILAMGIAVLFNLGRKKE